MFSLNIYTLNGITDMTTPTQPDPAMEAFTKAVSRLSHRDNSDGTYTGIEPDEVAELFHAHFPSPPLAVLRQAKEALEFYADKSNWDDKMTGSEGGEEEGTVMTYGGVERILETNDHGWERAQDALTAINSLLAGDGDDALACCTRPGCACRGITRGQLAAARAWVFTPSPPPPSEPTDKEMLDWLPISTAPERVTVLIFSDGNQFTGYYGGADAGWHHNAPGLPSVWPLPTHWMPLPATPRAAMSRTQEKGGRS